jgi:diguanylate cyclase (GGDEF)-like protein
MRTQSLSSEKNSADGRLILLHDMTEHRVLTGQLKEHSKELQELAVVDELTGVANRRQLLNLGERELLRARRFGHPFCAITFDVDHLKRINDALGRHIGDQVLRLLAPIVQNNIRDTDLLARSGGEEFAITLPETSLAAACEIAERIRKTVAETPIQTTSETLRITISIGVAASTAETRQLEDLLNAADIAMLKAKQAGRNRIFFADHSLARHFYFDFLPA